MHTGVVESGEVREGEEVHGEVDAHRREATARAHTATHIVHWTLRHVLGDHARQAGSLVAPGRLRFDFPHHSAVPLDVLEQAEELANRRLAEDGQVTIYETTMEEAKNQGAIALFGEKYGDFVRVVEVGDYSIELCGGTHVHHTGHIATRADPARGLDRRRHATRRGPGRTGRAPRDQRRARAGSARSPTTLGTDPKGAAERARQLVERVKQLESELGKLEKQERKQRRGAARGRRAGRGWRPARHRRRSTRTPTSSAPSRRTSRTGSRTPEGAAVVLGTGQGGKALLVAASIEEPRRSRRDGAGAPRTRRRRSSVGARAASRTSPSPAARRATRSRRRSTRSSLA